jgi:hypothetical protein
MAKKLFAALMALAAIGAFAAASASANPVLTHPTGTVLKTETLIKATNVGNTTMVTGLGTVTCTAAQMTGKIKTNSTASGSEGEVTSASFSNCTSWAGAVTVTPGTLTSTNGLPWCLEATTASDEGKLRGGACASAVRPIRFTLDFSFGECVYQRSTAANGTLRTDVAAGEDATVNLKEQEWTLFSGGGLCASSGKLNMTFTLETDTATAEPLYFSS